MNRSIVVFVTFLWLNLLNGQSEKTFYLGHSLVNFQIPQMVSELASYAGTPMQHKEHIGIGANLSWHWTQPQSGQGDLWKPTLSSQSFDNFIVTEAVPLKNHLQWSNTYAYLDSFYRYAAVKSPAVRLYIYETWHCINSGTPLGCQWDNDKDIDWRNRLGLDRPLWESIANDHNNRYAAQAYIIPGGQGLARLHDAIYAGNVPGMSSHRDLFSDDIHLTAIGNYFIACIMYSVIFEKSPEGLPHQLKDQYGLNIMPAPGPALALALQQVAWQTVCSYSRTNVSCTTSATDLNDYGPTLTFSYPILKNLSGQTVHATIYDLNGRRLQSLPVADCIDISHLESGFYLVSYPGRYKPLKIIIP